MKVDGLASNRRIGKVSRAGGSSVYVSSEPVTYNSEFIYFSIVSEPYYSKEAFKLKDHWLLKVQLVVVVW
tara:strand:+ start:9698 stop:9907 length:210 start_codon:yes stop_codon:yes gene_type:complete